MYVRQPTSYGDDVTTFHDVTGANDMITSTYHHETSTEMMRCDMDGADEDPKYRPLSKRNLLLRLSTHGPRLSDYLHSLRHAG